MAWRLGKSSALHAAAGPSSDTTQQPPLPFVTRDYYLEHPAVAALTEQQVEAERKRLGVVVHGEDVPKPVGSFVQASLPEHVLGTLRAAGYDSPTPIQRQAWPIAMSGRDVVGLAETGSGKTLAYLLPALVHASAQPPLKEGEGPLCLVLAPTRELACQIESEAARFGAPCGVRTAAVYGGVPKAEQVALLRKAPELLVATPGRLNELLSKKKTELTRCALLALDEADRTLDLGFEPQISAILGHMRHDRQSLLFSATWPAEVQTLAGRLIAPSHVIVEVGGALATSGRATLSVEQLLAVGISDELRLSIGRAALPIDHPSTRRANTSIEQRVLLCDDAGKMEALLTLLEEVVDGSRLLLFTSSKRRCDELTKELRLDGWPALALHGDKPQEERDWVLQQFRSAEHPLLVATDVAQRGLDVKGVAAVINVDCPETSEAYVHRIGRTGRAGEVGRAYTLVTPADARMCDDLVQVLRDAKQEVPPELLRLAAEGRAARYKRYKYS
ncbi:hypothetical protein EMIHUDRAFT_456181 [Emiliania huxleyi CCMP1516]|uniref:RNA helicase n=2 Tax=Emiliania huxleyi TaxID=2903 RepID=A0A0D3K7Y3_EMIH1|nr:hypothetical protein EMIHUDRAFT_456181 [Emiliania huxleyi CCMP1516]EOD31868.1 hypothetical protein EMIHUDRAFT_456181 [Emiliania huxleyi CCMP1516]|eukprot:XP_005784297.1 hypothetical protein EMIHUDRAFT_456181 [Emiliania huxleyi CCMP1516]